MIDLKYEVIYNNIFDVFQIVDSDNHDIIYYSDYLGHICESICELMNNAYIEGIGIE